MNQTNKKLTKTISYTIIVDQRLTVNGKLVEVILPPPYTTADIPLPLRGSSLSRIS